MMPPLMWSCTATVSIWCVCVSALDRPTCSCCCRNKWRNWNLIWFCSLNREMKEVDNFGCFLLQMTDLSLGQSFWNISSHYSIDLEGHMVPVNFTERACWAARKRVERASAVEVKKKKTADWFSRGKPKNVASLKQQQKLSLLCLPRRCHRWRRPLTSPSCREPIGQCREPVLCTVQVSRWRPYIYHPLFPPAIRRTKDKSACVAKMFLLFCHLFRVC